MDKVTKFLEKNVEWVAVALGGLFLLWMIYGNLIQRPVTVPLNGNPVTPGEVDPIIANGPAKQLEAAMLNPKPVEITVTPFQKALVDNLGAAPSAYPTLSAPWTQIPLPAGPTIVDTHPSDDSLIVKPVTVLPVAPAVTELQVSQGRSNVNVPVPAAAVGGDASPILNDQQGTPKDINWVSVGATFPVDKLAQEFTAKKVPSSLMFTTALRVQLVRQEQDSAGNWGAEQVINPLANVQLLALATNESGVNQQTGYRDWAEKGQVPLALLQPPFYKVLQADPWHAPGTAVVEKVVTEEAFDPAKVGNDLSKLTPEQRKIYDDYRAAKEKEARDKAAARRGATQRPTNPGAPGGGLGAETNPYAPGNRRPPATPARPTVPQPPAGLGAEAGPPVIPTMPGYPMPGMAGIPDTNNAPQGIGLPAGAFDVTKQANFKIWAHDDSVEPGKNYRYKLRYIIKSPVFQTFNVCNPQTLSDTFSITSADSDWTKPVNVQSETNFYAVNTFPSQSKATFEIFRWKNGAWQKQKVDVHPGDMIGSSEGQGANMIDFTTGWTFVDVREDPQNQDRKILILTASNGNIIKRELAADLANPEYRRLSDQAAAAAAGPRAAVAP